MATSLREDRLNTLLESCQQEVLTQIIGPFGLTPAMFDDKVGGNVTTQHNANENIFAKKSEELNRSDYDYTSAKKKKMQEAVKSGEMNSQEFKDAYTKKYEPTKRVDGNGKLAMNAELDHTIPVKEMHLNGGWMLDKNERTEMSSEQDNLNYTTHKTNRVKNSKSPKDSLSADHGFDESQTKPIIEKAQKAIDGHQPTLKDRTLYHGKELLATGASDAGKNALRHAFGVLLHEFVQGAFHELKQLLKQRDSVENLVDRILASLKRVMDRVINKLRDAWHALVDGGVQGFLSNFLTFLINSLITTSAKVVTIIRESTSGLWKAIKFMLNPPSGMSKLDIARQVSKIIAGVVTMGLGMLLEESVKVFIFSIPLLVPLADIVSPALTGIITGIATALLLYAMDHVFDWFAFTGTELLAAYEGNAEASAEVIHSLEYWLSERFKSSHLYELAVQEYSQIRQSYVQIEFGYQLVSDSLNSSLDSTSSIIQEFENNIGTQKTVDEELNSFITNYDFMNGKI